jgi:hypothetical protein
MIEDDYDFSGERKKGTAVHRTLFREGSGQLSRSASVPGPNLPVIANGPFRKVRFLPLVAPFSSFFSSVGFFGS